MRPTASKSLPDSDDGDWDVIVIGAGPAGAAAAYELARRQVHVLLVERCAFPRYKVCGACLNARAVDTLDRMRLGSRMARLKWMPLVCVQLGVGDQNVRLPLQGSFAVSREQFDECLVLAAVDEGATFLSETTAVVEANGATAQRSVKLRERGGAERTVRARIVLCAGGLASTCLRNLDGFSSQVATSAKVGLGAIATDFPDFYEPGMIAMAVGRGGYVGLTQSEPGVLNIAAAIGADCLRCEGGPAAAVVSILRASKFPAFPSLETADWHGTVPLTRRTSRVAGSRLFLLGDATGYVEPFTGEGIAWALQSAAAVVPLVMEGLVQWQDSLSGQWASLHRRLIVRKQAMCSSVAYLLRHPRMTSGVLRTLTWFPSLASRVVEQACGSRVKHPVFHP